MDQSQNKDHVSPKNENKDHVCGVCHSGFSKLSRLVRHQEMHDPARPYLACVKCQRSFKTNEALSRHLIMFKDGSCQVDPSAIKPFVCGTCGFRYQTKKSLRRHIDERHHSKIERVIKTSVGDAEVDVSKDDECSEVLIEKPYVCDPCGVRYQSMRSLRRHNDERHPLVKYVNERVVKKSMESGDGDAKQFTCETCGKMYQTSQGLRRHIFDHHSGV